MTHVCGARNATPDHARAPSAQALLPLELREQILTHLDAPDAVALSGVDTMWHAACVSRYTVERLFAKLPPGQKLHVPATATSPHKERAMWQRVCQTTRIERGYMHGTQRRALIRNEGFPRHLRDARVHLEGQRVEFSADSRYLVLRRGGEVRQTFHANVSNPEACTMFEAQMACSCASFSTDGQSALTCNWNTGRVTLWDTSADAFRVRQRIQADNNARVHSALLSQDATTVVLRLADQSLEVVSLTAPDTPHLKLTPQLAYGRIALSQNGQRLMIYDRHGEMEVWNLASSQASVREVVMPQRFCDCATLSQDGRFLVTTHGDDQACVWDLEQPDRPVHALSPSLGFVNAIAFSPDQKQVALCGEQEVGIFALTDASHPRTHCYPTQGEAKGVAFSPDGAYIAVADACETRMWRLDGAVSSAARIASIPQLEGVALSADGRYLVQSGADGTMQLWDFCLTSSPQATQPPGPNLKPLPASTSAHL